MIVKFRLLTSLLTSPNSQERLLLSFYATRRWYSTIVRRFLMRISLCLHSMIYCQKARYCYCYREIFRCRARLASYEDFSLQLKTLTFLYNSIRTPLCSSPMPSSCLPFSFSRSKAIRYFSRSALYCPPAESANLNLTTPSVSVPLLQKGQWMNCFPRERWLKQARQSVCCEEQMSMGQWVWESYQRQQILQSGQSRDYYYIELGQEGGKWKGLDYYCTYSQM